ncbi:hypothetical protein IPT12_22245 [Xanthomonas perforans]|uniref:Uncharacterized protein n=2 Tax=Xanthomonas perforans TaxID=442694 RepID=A0A0G9DIJ2_XANPE|nr:MULTISPECIES: hypothetical protein [Xanthomonas]WVK05914.1 hypothetical protein KWH09_10310 [Xanthomonas campestris pv. olitorii]APO98326.1 hypothetical protein BJD13_03960 [Xanthomonas perforans]AQS74923.1 hypothetical protein XPE_00060 [Xanthomonas perforans 91-118]KLC08968.1 hypothetical protein XP315_03715 [Xanthomonas perforans]KLC10093.1 hypothetical protein XP420_03180 [Xanthomonas perforans]
MDIDLIAKIAAPLLSLIVAVLIKHYLEGKSRLVTYIGNVAAFPSNNAPQTHMHSVVLQNAGKKSAANVRVPHGVPLASVSVKVNPPMHYNFEFSPSGTFQILIPTLAPKEQVTISYLYEEPTVWNQVSWPSKSDDGLAEIVQAIPAPRPNKLVRYSSVVLSMVGLSYILYWAVRYALQSAT